MTYNINNGAILKIYNTTTSSYDSYKVDCTSVSESWKNNLIATPNANGGSAVKVQTQSFDNFIYALQGVIITGRTGSLTRTALLQALKWRNDTYPLLLSVDIAGGNAASAEWITSSDGVTTEIPVTIASVNMPYTIDHSNNIRIGNGTITFRETT